MVKKLKIHAVAVMATNVVRNRKLSVNIPAGIDGNRIRLSGEGEVGSTALPEIYMLK